MNSNMSFRFPLKLPNLKGVVVTISGIAVPVVSDLQFLIKEMFPELFRPGIPVYDISILHAGVELDGLERIDGLTNVLQVFDKISLIENAAHNSPIAQDTRMPDFKHSKTILRSADEENALSTDCNPTAQLSGEFMKVNPINTQKLVIFFISYYYFKIQFASPHY